MVLEKLINDGGKYLNLVVSNDENSQSSRVRLARCIMCCPCRECVQV